MSCPPDRISLATAHDKAPTEYVVDPPDELQIASNNVKEIARVKQVVRADGKISLNLLGEVQVGGMTPKQIQRALTASASRFYASPDIRVEVESKSKFFAVFGRGATQQKKVPFTGNDNLVKALADAGVNEHAWPQQVLIVRPPQNPGEQPARAVVDFQHMQQTGDTTQNYALREGDIITLRGSPLDDFNFKMVQLLGPLSGATQAGSGIRAATTPGGY